MRALFVGQNEMRSATRAARRRCSSRAAAPVPAARGPVSNVCRTALFAWRKLSVARAAILTVREGLSALYNSADFVPTAMTRTDDDGEVDGESSRRRRSDDDNGRTKISEWQRQLAEEALKAKEFL